MGLLDTEKVFPPPPNWEDRKKNQIARSGSAPNTERRTGKKLKNQVITALAVTFFSALGVRAFMADNQDPTPSSAPSEIPANATSLLSQEIDTEPHGWTTDAIPTRVALHATTADGYTLVEVKSHAPGYLTSVFEKDGIRFEYTVGVSVSGVIIPSDVIHINGEEIKIR